jgi:hypothetical protein
MSGGTYYGSYSTAISLGFSPATITATGTVDAAGAYGVYAANAATLYNDGLVLAADGIAVDLKAGGLVENGDTGHTGARIYGAQGLALGAAGTVENFGTIDGISLGVGLGAGGSLTNAASGKIVVSGVSSTAIKVVGAAGFIDNAGLIGVEFESTIDNYSTGIGIELQDGGSLDNSGTIELIHGYKVYSAMIGVTLDNGGTVTNSGLIEAGYYTTNDLPGFVAAHPSGAGLLHLGGGHHVSPFAVRIVADQYTGLGVGLYNGTLFNQGQIYGRNVGVKLGANATGNYVDNTEKIIGRQAGIQMYAGLVENSGLIVSGGTYAAGIDLVGGTVINTGAVAGGQGIDDYGIYAAATDAIAITNEAGGVIEGGTGIEFYGYADNILVTAGTIEGENTLPNSFYTYSVLFAGNAGGTIDAEGGAVFIGIIGGNSGVTLDLESGSSAGTIDGILGGPKVIFETGGYWDFQGQNEIKGGLTVNGGTVILEGTIDGGFPESYAIDFASGTDRLVLTPTAEWYGTISGDGATSTLELASAAVAGLVVGLGGTDLHGFGFTRVDAGGTWALEGGATVAAGYTLADLGSVTITNLDWLENDGLVKVNGGYMVDNGSLSGSGTVEITNGGVLEFGTLPTGGLIDFGNSGGTLKLAQALGSGIEIGTMSVGAAIEFTGIAFQAGDTATYQNGDLYLLNGSTILAALQATDLSLPAGYSLTVGQLDGNAAIELACYWRGTRLKTPSGETAIEDLGEGDLLTTASGAALPIRWIGRSTKRIEPRLSRRARERLLPIRVRAGALGDDLPVRDLLLSPSHCLWFEGALVEARHLVNGVSILRDESFAAVDYFHVELDVHTVVLAEGVAAETYLDCGNRGGFEGMDHAADFPRDAAVDGRRCAPVLRPGPDLAAIRASIASRLGRFGIVATEAPDLHLLADGAVVRGIELGEGVHRFELAAVPRSLRIRSRAAMPVEVDPLATDRRRLGVALSRIAVSGAGRVVELDHDRTLLSDGFHQDEDDRRWTDGDAGVPAEILAGLTGPVTVDLHVRATMLYFVGVAAEAAEQARLAA